MAAPIGIAGAGAWGTALANAAAAVRIGARGAAAIGDRRRIRERAATVA